MNNMYKENIGSLNLFKGCDFDCIYCKVSFKRQAKRQKCYECKIYLPHLHKERLLKKSPKTTGNQFVFLNSCGDTACATEDQKDQIIKYVGHNPQTTFLLQTKAPKFLQEYESFPSNLILGITLETDKDAFGVPFENNHSIFTMYRQISKAPVPFRRALDFVKVNHRRKWVTVEPIMDFSLCFSTIIRAIEPEVVYIGYMNHINFKKPKTLLPEPTITQVRRLISELEANEIEVRKKTIRSPWWD